MLRTALQPRWYPLHLLMVAAVGFCVLLGAWQLGLARQEAPALDPAPVPLTEVTAPRQSFLAGDVGRLVTAQGRYDASSQLLVAGRQLDGREGFWLLTPLLVGDAAVPVVRGWVPDADDPAAAPQAVPAGPVRVTGRVQPREVPADVAGPGGALPPGQVAAVDTVELVNRWSPPLYNLFLVMTEQDPSSAVAAVPPPVPPPATQLSLRNLAYGIQWLVFGAFAGFLWWRALRDDAGGDWEDGPAPSDPEPAGPDAETRGALR